MEIKNLFKKKEETEREKFRDYIMREVDWEFGRYVNALDRYEVGDVMKAAEWIKHIGIINNSIPKAHRWDTCGSNENLEELSENYIKEHLLEKGNTGRIRYGADYFDIDMEENKEYILAVFREAKIKERNEFVSKVFDKVEGMSYSEMARAIDILELHNYKQANCFAQINQLEELCHKQKKIVDAVGVLGEALKKA